MIERIEGSTTVRRVSSTSVSRAATVQPHAELSGQSGLLVTARALAARPAPIDHERISQLRQAIRDGRYVTDPHSIARAMQEHQGE